MLCTHVRRNGYCNGSPGCVWICFGKWAAEIEKVKWGILNPVRGELIAVGTAAGLSVKKCETNADEIRAYTEEMLKEYLL